MPISPQKFREVVFLLVYSADCGSPEEEDMTPFLMKELAITKKILREAHAEKNKVQEKLEEIDPLIAQHSLSYAFQRIPRIERNVLRLGVYELLHSATVPAKVAIAEAIRLSRKFSSAESASFVNAILDGIYHARTL